MDKGGEDGGPGGLSRLLIRGGAVLNIRLRTAGCDCLRMECSSTLVRDSFVARCCNEVFHN